jgi:hypothetical protein
MSAETIIARLPDTQSYGKGWRAACPNCGGKGRKLAINEADDGRILLHCFAGCDAADVVKSAGLTLADLFPVRLAADSPLERRQRARLAREAQWGAALEMLALESMIVSIAAKDLAQRDRLSDEDLARLALAQKRIDEACSVLRERSPWRPARAVA